MSIENLKTTHDPFADADDGSTSVDKKTQHIHIRVQQRNGRKCVTTIAGVPLKFDGKKILKVLKKEFACNGSIVEDPEAGQVIQLQGDKRKDALEFLTEKKKGLGLARDTITVHGA